MGTIADKVPPNTREQAASRSAGPQTAAAAAPAPRTSSDDRRLRASESDPPSWDEV